MEKIEERFVLGKNSHDQYSKYAALYKKQMENLEQETSNLGK
jgi:hypothetical protein